MTIARRFTTAVTITEPGEATTRYGDTVAPDFDNPASVTEAKGWLVQSQASEQIGGRDITITIWILMLPASVSISAAARVASGDREFTVDGEPAVRDYGMNPHVAARLRVVSEVAA